MRAPIPDEEMNLITDCVYCDYLIEVLEHDQQLVFKSTFKIPEAWEGFLDAHIGLLLKERGTLRNLCREKGIKVMDSVWEEGEFLRVPYTARGYQGEMRFWRFALQLEGAKRLEQIFLHPNKTP
ncbi:hypothetical protein ACFYKX_11050 [Cytobacillus sp. FJAT-54145]|uniref:Uncharacterized protein n=1 Tax=Cytobacillus spartinae TaxID=3299023 RepID=A0ABW6KAB1_9BACI